MTAKMRKVMYLVETPPRGGQRYMYFPEMSLSGERYRFWTLSYKKATSDGNRIIETKLVPVDDLTDEQREAREKYHEKVWAKFHNKPRA